MISFGKKKIFLDYASATPTLFEVKREMNRFWSTGFHNPSSIYEEGRKARKILEEYRGRIAKIIGVGSKDVIFTSGGTEADNLAIVGSFNAAKAKFEKPHLVISSIEHPAIYETALSIKENGGELTIIPVDENGVVNAQDVKKAIKENTFLVSVMYANNEIGTIEPISKIGRIVREYRKKNESEYPYFHTDASQAPNYLPINAEALAVDMMTLDAGKIYGPKGIGVLIVRPTVTIRPTMWGGGQEKGLRSGTENLALISGFAKSLEIVQSDRLDEEARLRTLKKNFIERMKEYETRVVINADIPETLPNIISISFPGILSEFLLLKLDSVGVEVSVGSSCSTNSGEIGSRVINEIGKPNLSESTIRFSLGRFTTEREVRKALDLLCLFLDHDKMSA